MPRHYYSGLILLKRPAARFDPQICLGFQGGSVGCAYKLRFTGGGIFGVSLFLISTLMLILISGPIHRTAAAEKPEATEHPTGEATVILIEGMVSLLDADGKPVQQLSPGVRCRPEDRIRTGPKARLSLKLPDGTYVRFSEFTTCELVSLRATEIPKQRNIQIRLLAGDVWVNAAQPYTGEGAVRILLSKAVIQTSESICRLTAFSDHSALLKVYRGLLEVRHFQAPEFNPATGISQSPMKNNTTWNHLLKTMQQLYIRADGSATNPFRFMTRTDENSWVLWNREQDAKIGTPSE